MRTCLRYPWTSMHDVQVELGHSIDVVFRSEKQTNRSFKTFVKCLKGFIGWNRWILYSLLASISLSSVSSDGIIEFRITKVGIDHRDPISMVNPISEWYGNVCLINIYNAPLIEVVWSCNIIRMAYNTQCISWVCAERLYEMGVWSRVGVGGWGCGGGHLGDRCTFHRI